MQQFYEKFAAFISYFFGKGDTPEFRNFTLAHFLPILVAVGIIYLMYRYRDALRESPHLPKIALTLALVSIFCEMSYFWRLVGVESLNANPQEHLPITICGWSIIFSSYLVITKNQTLFDISYFWLFSGTLFALITPTVITYTGPTRFRYYQFWGEHTLGYIIIFFAIFVYKMRPTIKSAIKSYIFLAVWTIIATLANETLNMVVGPHPVTGESANYLFMAGVEKTKSVLDLLPTNIGLRMLVMGGIMTLMYLLAYLPWFIMDLRAKKHTVTETVTDTENTPAIVE